MGSQWGIGTLRSRRPFLQLESLWRQSWDSQEIILINYLEKGKTINGASYSSLLDRPKTELQEKCPQLAHKKSFSIMTTQQLTPLEL
jgi:hypothetical protein